MQGENTRCYRIFNLTGKQSRNQCLEVESTQINEKVKTQNFSDECVNIEFSYYCQKSAVSDWTHLLKICFTKPAWNAMICFEQLSDLANLTLNLCIAHKLQFNHSIIHQTFSLFLRLYQKSQYKYFFYLTILSVSL